MIIILFESNILLCPYAVCYLHISQVLMERSQIKAQALPNYQTNNTQDKLQFKCMSVHNQILHVVIAREFGNMVQWQSTEGQYPQTQRACVGLQYYKYGCCYKDSPNSEACRWPSKSNQFILMSSQNRNASHIYCQCKDNTTQCLMLHIFLCLLYMLSFR